MRYLKTYRLFESNINNFIDALTEELKHIDFDLTYSYEDAFLQIDKPGIGTFITFNLDGDPKLSKDIFSIDNLRKECLERLESNKVDWKCSDMIKDDYDTLCTTILVFIEDRKSTRLNSSH